MAVTAALTLSAASIAGISGTSRADGPLDPLAPVTSPLAPATAPVTQAANRSRRVATATQPVTQAAATTTKPVTQAAATATQPVTQAAATATKPVTQAAADRHPARHTGRRDRHQAGHAGRRDRDQAGHAGRRDNHQARHAGSRHRDQAGHAGGRDGDQAGHAGGRDRHQASHAGGRDRDQARDAGRRDCDEACRSRPTRRPPSLRRRPRASPPSRRRTPPRPPRSRSRAPSCALPRRRRPPRRRRAAARAARTTRHVEPGVRAHRRAGRLRQVRKAKHVHAATGGRAVAVPSPHSCRQRGRSAARGDHALAAGRRSRHFGRGFAPRRWMRQSSGSGSSNTALGLAALIGAGGVALLRARQLSAAAGIADIATLTALGHSASIVLGRVLPHARRAVARPPRHANASLTAARPRLRARSAAALQFGVGGVVSGAAEAAGGRSATVATVVPSGDTDDDRTPLVALLFALLGYHRRRARRDRTAPPGRSMRSAATASVQVPIAIAARARAACVVTGSAMGAAIDQARSTVATPRV